MCGWSCLPEFLAAEEFCDALLLNDFKVPNVGVVVYSAQEIQFAAFFEFRTLPASVDFFFCTTVTDLAGRGSAAAAARTLAPQPDHQAQDFVSSFVVLIRFEKLRYHTGKAFEFRFAQFLTQVTCEVSDPALIDETIAAVKAAICDHINTVSH